MKLSEFDYVLPDELIAQKPCAERDGSRMMTVDRQTEAIAEDRFSNLTDYLNKDDLLVINDSKVIPARLFAVKETGGAIEILLLKEHDTGSNIWEVLLRPAKRLRTGAILTIDAACRVHIMERISDKKWLVRFDSEIAFADFLERFGSAPLPPYIRRNRAQYTADDRERYQTVYAKTPGSVAAPTAGLHFSEKMMDTIRAAGIQVAAVTLHVGYGTFVPIETENIEDHVMEQEYYEVTSEAARLINRADRVIAVGTTSTRVIESAAGDDGMLKASSGWTGRFIYPGYQFRRVGGLLTNFHLPCSSLLLLVSAFAGRELIKKAYRRAVKNRFRFYSYGDCMLII